jgi:hypothetical protein
MTINILSTYIRPEPDTIEEKIDQILRGNDQLTLMANSLQHCGTNIKQYVISNTSDTIAEAVIYPTREINRNELTLEILRLQKDFFSQAADDTHWIVCDPDFLFFRDVTFVFDDDFDVAMTVRPDRRMPFNSGIFFINNTNQNAVKFFTAQVRIIEELLMSNSQWFGDQLVLKHMIDNAHELQESGIFLFEDLRIKLLSAKQFNFSPNREHPNLLNHPECHAYHFKGRCRSYMKYFYKHYSSQKQVPKWRTASLFYDFINAERERKKLKPVYEAAITRHKPN